MDRIELQTLADEIRKDSAVAVAAYETACARFGPGTPVANEGCAFHLARFYNIVEQLGLRVAKAFENSMDDEKGWHTELIRRLSIAIQGVRPALFAAEVLQPLRDLRAFRHVFVHAYELELDPEKLALLLKYARIVAGRLPDLVEAFVREAAQQQEAAEVHERSGRGGPEPQQH